MKLHIINNEADYDAALERVDELMSLNPELGTPLSDELEVLVVLIEKYEETHWAIAEPDPIEAIKIRMEQMQLDRKALEPFIGNRSKVSEVLSGDIGLSVAMISKLSAGLHLPVELLIRATTWYRKHGDVTTSA